MAINLQRFMSTMNARPPAMASDFEVKIFCPAIGSVDELTFRAENMIVGLMKLWVIIEYRKILVEVDLMLGTTMTIRVL